MSDPVRHRPIVPPGSRATMRSAASAESCAPRSARLGGAFIPGLMSLYLLVRNRLWGVGLIAIACVTALCHLLADPVPGVGIAMPVLVPSLVAAIVALLLSREQAAPLAYICGSLGTLFGADLLNLDKV